MVSPETLLRYPFFNFLSTEHCKALAEVATFASFEAGEVILQEGQAAEALYVLLTGSVDLYFTVEVEYHPEQYKELFFSVVRPGELFGISTCVEPRVLTSSARAAHDCRTIRIPMAALDALCKTDQQLAGALIQQVMMTAIDRLNATRFQLAVSLASVSV
jgi:CRP-like cAMP-binding protein